MDRQAGPKLRKQPATLRHLEAARGLLDLSGRRGRATWATLLLGFFFLLRVSNIAGRTQSSYDEDYVLLRRDVTFFDRVGKPMDLTEASLPLVDGMEIRVKRSKTDQEGVGYRRHLFLSNRVEMCVVRAVAHHLLESSDLPAAWPVGAYDGRHGVLRGERARTVVSRGDISDLLKTAGVQVGDAPSNLGTHSLRIGGATALHALGVPDAWIMFMGFWKSKAYLLYCRPTEAVPRNIAALMASCPVEVYHDQLRLPTSSSRAYTPWGGIGAAA